MSHKNYLTLLCAGLCAFVVACSSTTHENAKSCEDNRFPSIDTSCRLVHDISAEIVAINGDDAEKTEDKFHTPVVTNAVLFRVQGTDYYFKLVKGDGTKDLHDMSDPWIYNHKIGDVVTFKYLLKERFFEIKQ